MKNFHYDVKVTNLSMINCERDEFREKLLAIPYQLYEVEQIKNGLCIVINKPGGKRDQYGRLSINDFQVFLHNPTDRNLLLPPYEMWLPSHKDLLSWVSKCREDEKKLAKFLVRALWRVMQGIEPDAVINLLTKTKEFDDILDFFDDAIGVECSAEIILKLYKWIWGQEG